MRRNCHSAVIFMKRHRPSGVVCLFMTVFIVAYVLIVKLESLKHDNIKNENSSYLVADSKMMKNILHTTPKEILADLARAELKSAIKTADKVNYKKENTYVEHVVTTAIAIKTENEVIINTVLEDDEKNIDHHWNSYLDKNKNDIMSGNANRNPHKPNKHMNFQGVRIDKPKTIPRIPKNLSKSVQLFDALKESKELRNSINSNKCVLLKTLHGDAPICVHDPDYDEIISASILEKGSWEPMYLYMTGMILKLNSELMFLDIGCNIGVYTILASKLGATVIAVDPNKANLRLLTKSVSLNDRRNMVTLLWNAVSDVRENVTLNAIVGNVGGMFVNTVGENTADDETQATAIQMDDLIGFFDLKPVFIKMDIETFEWKALQGGRHFFKQVDVRYVLMEWIYHREADTGKEIIKFMGSFGLYGHINAHHVTKLETENYKSWPDNVLWIKY